MPRNKKIKNEYRQLVKLRDQYEYNLKYHKEKLETLFIKNKVEHKAIKKEISVMENRYPSLKDSLVTRTIMPTKLPGGTYSGSFKSVTDQYPHGHGTFWYSDGKVYSGGWKNNQYHGQGEITLSDKTNIVAEFKNKKIVGKITMTFPDGRKYFGQYKNNKIEGQGTMTFSSGRKYVGQWKNGERNGRGIETFPNEDIYVGQFKKDKRDGRGTQTWSDGKYVGQWKNDNYHGQGTEITFNSKYIGEWKDNNYYKGIFTMFDGKKITSIEEGIFQENFLVKGSETIYSRDKNKLCVGIKKEIGKWKLSKGVCSEFISGVGKEIWYRSEADLKKNNYIGYMKGIFNEANLIKGEILNPTLIGYSEYKSIKKIILTGKMRSLKNIEFEGSTEVNSGEIFYEIDQAYADGSVEGQYKKYKGEIAFLDTPNGNGKMIFEHGSKYVGEWYEGVRHGQGTLTHTNGNKYTGQWKLGHLIK